MSADRSPAQASRYSTVAIVLHWIIAAAIILQVVLASRMEVRTPQAFAVTQLHKSIGITILLLSLARLGWRLGNPPPPEAPGLKSWETRLSLVVHWGFYVIMIGMPLTGWLMVSTSRTGIPTLLYGLVHWPNLPGLADLAPAAKRAWHEVGEVGHGLLAKLIWLLLALHVAGALKHQLFRPGEPVLGRMAPGAVTGRWLEPRLFIIAAGAAAVVAFGLWIDPPRPAAGPAAVPAVATGPQATSVAAPPPAPTPTPAATSVAPHIAPLPPTVWKVSAGSALTFATTWGGEAVKGRFDRWTADILFSPDALEKSKVTVTIDLASVKTGDEQRDASLPAADWFDTASHPKAVFTATRFGRVGEDRFVAHGTLTLRGVTKPLDLPFRLKIAGDTARVTGTTSLDRLAYGVGQGEWKSTDSIPAKVAVGVDLQARRSGP